MDKIDAEINEVCEMKVLITSDWYTPAVNGVVASVKSLKRGLEERGHEVRILTLSQSTHSGEKDGITYIGSVTAGLVYPGARLRTALAEKYVRELVEWQPDVVHSQCEFSTFFLARRISEELDIPLVHTYHTVYEDYTHYFSPSPRLGRRAVAVFTRWISARTDCIIVPTGKVRLLLEGYGVKHPVFVVPSGIDLGRFEQPRDPERVARQRRQLAVPEGNLVLVYVGRLAEEKNVDELLRLRAQLGDAPLTLLLVGDGPDRSRLEGIASSLGLRAPAVVFAGMQPSEQIGRWYQAGDLFVSASTSETQGLTYVEALASGVPALCRADPCLDGVIREGENGWTYCGEEDFLRKLELFRADPEKWPELSRQARESADEFSIPRFAQRAESIYLEQIARRQQAEKDNKSSKIRKLYRL